MRSFITLAFASVFFFVGCGSDSAAPKPPAQSSSTLKYVGSCTPKECDGLPVPEIACASGATTTTCAPGKDGTCHVDITCDGTTKDADVTSWEPCDDAKCGPVTEIGCADGATLTRQCGKLDGAACAWLTTCSPKPGPACDPSKCGPEPAIAPICKDGSVGGLVCRTLGSGCGWVSNCP